jgi:hypothetical protein
MTLSPETAKIYAIKSNTTPQIYIGSTKLPIKLRYSIHKAQYKKHLTNSHPFLTSFNIISYPDSYIVLLDEFPYTDKLLLRIKENEYIQQYKQYAVNKNRAYLSQTDKKAMIKKHNDNRNNIFILCHTCHKVIKKRNAKYHLNTHNN